MTPDRVARHVAAFNATVGSGDWSAFAGCFAIDAALTFEGVPVGPFRGRDAIAAAYAAQPPDDTLETVAVQSDGAHDVVRFAWSRGGHGTMRFTWRDDEVAALAVSFDG